MSEVFEVINASKSFKSPGPDGITMEFYKNFWPFIGSQCCTPGYVHFIGLADRHGLSPIWKGICNLFEMFGISLICQAGEISSFQFWLDPWFTGERLCNRYPALFSAALNPNISIEEARIRAPSSESIGWSIQFRYLVPSNLLSRLSDDLTPFLYCSGSDSYEWRWTRDEIFSTSSLYRILSFRGVGDCRVPFLWQNNFPPALSLNNWLIEKDRLPTRDRLIKHNVNVPASCPLCSNGDESHSHLFRDCEYTTQGWNMVVHLRQTCNINGRRIHDSKGMSRFFASVRDPDVLIADAKLVNHNGLPDGWNVRFSSYVPADQVSMLGSDLVTSFRIVASVPKAGVFSYLIVTFGFSL
ncbi:hypothetical protein Cni_G28384 [Canna indica]|uniref:Reverse transcriptase zinc-binding domain-containing protein n=1 Tax=Canna indica TaxID=4628 RepID=A0AAQ3L5F7_9LILI|nr:hypothetical protein Cni_G28384 [Canna indica]